MYHAIMSGNEQLVLYLLEKGADPNLANREGFLPLHLTLPKKLTSIANLLLKKGADPDKKGKLGSPLSYAIFNNKEELVEIF